MFWVRWLFRAAVLAAARYSRGGFNPCLAVSTRRIMVQGGSTFHLEPGTIHPFWNLLVPDVLDDRGESKNYITFDS